MKTAQHPNKMFTIRFRDKFHTYTDNRGTRYLSGTSVSKPYFPKFDPIAVSEKCAVGDNPLYAGRDPKDIRAEWSAEGNRGSTEGDNLHEYAEGIMSCLEPERLPKPISERCELMFSHVDTVADWLFTRFDFVAAEKIIFSPDLEIAGMVDLLMFDPDSRTMWILDWKNNKVITSENNFKSAYSPIKHLQDTHKAKYSLQLSIYQYILIRENYYPQAKKYRRALIHVGPGGFDIMPLEYYEFEVLEILKHEKRI